MNSLFFLCHMMTFSQSTSEKKKEYKKEREEKMTVVHNGNVKPGRLLDDWECELELFWSWYGSLPRSYRKQILPASFRDWLRYKNWMKYYKRFVLSLGKFEQEEDVLVEAIF